MLWINYRIADTYIFYRVGWWVEFYHERHFSKFFLYIFVESFVLEFSLIESVYLSKSSSVDREPELPCRACLSYSYLVKVFNQRVIPSIKFWEYHYAFVASLSSCRVVVYESYIVRRTDLIAYIYFIPFCEYRVNSSDSRGRWIVNRSITKWVRYSLHFLSVNIKFILRTSVYCVDSSVSYW